MIGTELAKIPGFRSMNGIHDMGGMDGFGAVEREADEPVFHAPWEGRVIAMMRAMGAAGAWNLDMFRYARERQPPTVYLTSSYYKSWLLGVETLAVERGYVATEELAAGHALHSARPLPRAVLRPVDVPAAVRRALRAAAGLSGAVRTGRSRAHKDYASDDAHPSSQIRPGTVGRDRAGARMPGLSGSWALGNGRRFPVALHGGVCWAQFGAPTATPRSRSRSTLSSPIWSPRDRRRPQSGTLAEPCAARGWPVFREAWEAQAFALTLTLHERGVFTWSEWTSALASEIRRAQAAGRSRYRRDILSPLACGAGGNRCFEGPDHFRKPCALPRCMGSGGEPHAAWKADRTRATDFPHNGARPRQGLIVVETRPTGRLVASLPRIP